MDGYEDGEENYRGFIEYVSICPVSFARGFQREGTSFFSFFFYFSGYEQGIFISRVFLNFRDVDSLPEK